MCGALETLLDSLAAGTCLDRQPMHGNEAAAAFAAEAKGRANAGLALLRWLPYATEPRLGQANGAIQGVLCRGKAEEGRARPGCQGWQGAGPCCCEECQCSPGGDPGACDTSASHNVRKWAWVCSLCSPTPPAGAARTSLRCLHIIKIKRHSANLQRTSQVFWRLPLARPLQVS